MVKLVIRTKERKNKVGVLHAEVGQILKYDFFTGSTVPSRYHNRLHHTFHPLISYIY
jgi:hypothetical protein